MKSHTLLILLAILFFTISCSKNEYLDATIDQPTVEFSSPTIDETISFKVNTVYDLAVPIQIFGGTTDKTISVQAKTDLKSDNYSIASTKSLNNTAIDSIHISINTNTLTKGNAYTIQLTLSSSDVTISENYKTCLITFSQETFIDFFTGTYSCKESATNTVYDVVFTKQNETIVKSNNFWDFPAKGQTVPYEFTQDENHTVKIPDNTDWTDYIGNVYHISGSGTYDMDGNFVVNYEMIDATTNKTYQTGCHTFTKKRK